jgi:hypothetical protein
MKLKSFLFLIAALAIGLVFASCGGDTEIEYRDRDVNKGYASDADAIMAAFAFADDVYLSRRTDLKNGTVVIETGKTLHVDGQTIEVNNATAIVAVGTGKLDWDNKATSKIDGTGAVLVGITIGENDTAHYSNSATSYVLLTADGDIVAGASGGYRAALATDTAAMGKVFKSGTYLDAEGGTTAYLIGSFDKTSLEIAGGTLVVTGNLGTSNSRVATIKTDTPLTIYGYLYGGTVGAASTQNIITDAGTVTVYKDADIDSGAIGNQLVINGKGDFGTVSVTGTLAVTGNASFTGNASISAPFNVDPGKAVFSGNATFTAPLTVAGGADFSGDATFAGGNIGQRANFTSGNTVSGNVTVATLGFSGSGTTNSLVLSTDGEIIYTSGISGSFLTSTNNVGTLATIAGPLTFSISTSKLAVSGAGSIVVSKAINLADANTIEVDGTTGVYFSATEGKIDAETYTLGGQVGTLSTDKSTDGGFILTKDGITKLVNAGSASLSYALANGEGKFFLNIKQGSMATLTGVNISASVGSISFEPGATLYLAAGGSVTAANVAWGGTIAGSVAAGSLLVGSLSATNTGGSIAAADVAAGSVGVKANGNFILSSSVFHPTGATVDQGLTGAEGAVTDGGSAAAGGSILIFGRN